MDDQEFFSIELAGNSPNKCSPAAPPPPWHGLVIQAPSRTEFTAGVAADEQGAFAVIPVCGVFCVEVPKTPQKDSPVIVAVDLQSGKRYQGPIRELDPSPMAPDPDDDEPFDPDELEGMSVTSYFNANVANFVPLPAAPARYEIWVEFRKMSSNKVVIQVEQI